MAGPAWLAGSFAAVMLLTALYCAARLVLARTQRRPTEQDVDLVHVLMGVAMAGMLAPRVLPLPALAAPGGGIWAGAWSLVFGVATVWFAARIALSYRVTGRLRPVGSHHLPHLIMSATMVFMLAAVHVPLLALVLAQFMVGYVMWAADRLPALARAGVAGGGSAGATWGLPRPPLSLRLASCCNIVMGLVMGYMLIISR